MILYTIFPLEQVLEEPNTEYLDYIEMEYEGNVLILQPLSSNVGKIVRLISSDPNDYLNPQYQPGTLLHFVPSFNEY